VSAGAETVNGVDAGPVAGTVTVPDGGVTVIPAGGWAVQVTVAAPPTIDWAVASAETAGPPGWTERCPGSTAVR
jgi:hypothetical protein